MAMGSGLGNGLGAEPAPFVAEVPPAGLKSARKKKHQDDVVKVMIDLTFVYSRTVHSHSSHSLLTFTPHVHATRSLRIRSSVSPTLHTTPHTHTHTHTHTQTTPTS